MLKYLRKNKQGFTLIELLVVIAIIGILAAIIAPQAFKAVDKSKVAAAEADLKAIKSGVTNYYTDTSKWPVTDADEVGFVTKPDDVDGWNGPYLERWPAKNPWGGTYTFTNGEEVKGIVDGDDKYITMTDVPAAAINRLEADLDGGTADADAGVIRSSGTTVYYVISNE